MVAEEDEKDDEEMRMMKKEWTRGGLRLMIPG